MGQVRSVGNRDPRPVPRGAWLILITIQQVELADSCLTIATDGGVIGGEAGFRPRDGLSASLVGLLDDAAHAGIAVIRDAVDGLE